MGSNPGSACSWLCEFNLLNLTACQFFFVCRMGANKTYSSWLYGLSEIILKVPSTEPSTY